MTATPNPSLPDPRLATAPAAPAAGGFLKPLSGGASRPAVTTGRSGVAAHLTHHPSAAQPYGSGRSTHSANAPDGWHRRDAYQPPAALDQHRRQA
mgnify:CR=1 FL=1